MFGHVLCFDESIRENLFKCKKIHVAELKAVWYYVGSKAMYKSYGLSWRKAGKSY